MTKPIIIKCKTNHLPGINKLKKLADSKHHVVLQFVDVSEQFDKESIIIDLRKALTDYSVFDSGGDKKSDWITVMLVVNHALILEKKDEILSAIKSYIDSCVTLLAKYKNGKISKDWDIYKHGDHQRFENLTTGQIVEAPLSGSNESGFSLIKLTFQMVINCIKHNTSISSGYDDG